MKSGALSIASFAIPQHILNAEKANADKIITEFIQPPEEARPWVYWCFMDGHLTREGITADLEAMKQAGLGGAIFLEVGIGIEPGPVQFMSKPWQQLLGHAFSEADRLGLEMALAAGPGWCGCGGPWVKPDQSMQHLVASKIIAQGPTAFDVRLPQPQPRTPFFGEATLPPELHNTWKEFYRDEFVLAFPTPPGDASIPDIDEKALYTRGSYSSQIPGPYSSRPWVRPFFSTESSFVPVPAERCIASRKVLNLTDRLSPDGRLLWSVPPGSWTIMRFGRTLTGQTTRPAPKLGLGLESDKFDGAAIDAHFDTYIVSLLDQTGATQHHGRGLVALHFDSWEMSSQNWSVHFHEEFTRRRGYDAVAFLPTFAGFVVDTSEVSERFLWDVRQTAQELVSENQAQRLRERGKQRGLQLSLEPYDLNPCADLQLGSAADIPMGEFWSKTDDAPPTDFSLAEAASIGHTQGHKVIGAESFTAMVEEMGRQHPASMKAQGDWAFCQGINKFVIHRYQAQPWLDRFPGMTMGLNGGYGVHWERTQTWWDLVPAYHLYLSRCQQMLRRGLFVADILYLAPEGAPNVFFPPRSSFRPGKLADRRGYNFDGCAPETLIARASVNDGRIVFPDGMSYRLLVLPQCKTMTPRLLQKVVKLVEDGATILGTPPHKCPSLSNYPACDDQVRELASKLWGQDRMVPERRVGRGCMIYDVEATRTEISNPLEHAKWIWSAQSDGGSSVTAGKLYFERKFLIRDARTVLSALVTITADQSYDFSLNGHFVMTGNTVQRARRTDVSSLLRSGTNVFTVAVKENADKSGPSGLIASLIVNLRDGSKVTTHTDQQWTFSSTEKGSQLAAAELGPYGISPWNLDDSAIEQPDIYPSYAVTADLLSQRGIGSDFEAGASIRYIHRRDDTEDFYFLANGEAQPQTTICHFRVMGRQPEWWDPLTGEHRDLPEFAESNGRTSIPIHLEAFESGFVIFRKPVARRSSKRRTNFPRFETISTIAPPWEVAFDPKWGGPERVAFPQLEDWSKHPEPGIRHYSGKAVYKTAFDCNPVDSAMGYFLSLGTVRNIAAIKVNGHDLGVVWCDPWRLAIPEGVLQRRGNTLEIIVANLWVNRLIGDSDLLPEQRLTWTTGNPFHSDDPLLESGLLGPVVIQAIASV